MCAKYFNEESLLEALTDYIDLVLITWHYLLACKNTKNKTSLLNNTTRVDII